MSTSNRSTFVYVTYIRTTAEKLWRALTDSEFSRQYWFGVSLECAWKKGAPWKMVYPDGTVTDSGEILELEPAEGAVKLTVIHEIERPGSKLIDAVSDGWPKVLSNLKSLLETGDVAMQGK